MHVGWQWFWHKVLRGPTRILESWQFGDSDLHRKNVILNPQELKADLFLIWVDGPSRSQQLHLIWLPHDQRRRSGSELVAVPCLLLLPWQLLRARILHYSLGNCSWIPPLLADRNCLRNANVCEESTVSYAPVFVLLTDEHQLQNRTCLLFVPSTRVTS